MFKNTASQKVIVFAFDATTNVPKTGDAANITAYISKDFGAVTVLGDTSATEMDATNAPGYYLFDITQTETNADTILVSGKSSTANIKILGAPAAIFTNPINFTTASIDSNGRVDVIKVAGTTQTAKDIGGAVPAAAAGAAGGLLISGSNSGTTTLAALTVTGNFLISDGMTIAAPATTNRAGLAITGNGTGDGVDITSGNGATGIGLNILAASTTGHGMLSTGAGSSNLSSAGIRATGGSGGGPGIRAIGGGNGAGIQGVGGATGAGLSFVGGATSGDGILIQTTDGHGINFAPNGTSRHGIFATGGTAGTSDGIKAVAGTGGVDIRGSITGNLSGSVGSVTGLTASNLDTTVSSRMATYTQPTGFLAATFPSGTVANTTNITAGTITTTTNLTNLPSIPANWLTAAGTAADFGTELATAIWTDTVAGDFTVALSVGKSVMNGVSLGTGLTVASVSGSVGSVTGLTASNLDTTISSRMATYTQPTGFLAATFPSGTIANTTNITAGIITTVTNLTNAPTAGDFTATMKTSLNASTPAAITGAVGSVTAGVTLAASQLFAKKNTQLTAFMFKMVLASDHITAATGKTITANRVIDGGAFGACTNAPTEISAGWYKITLSAADMNGTTIALKFTEASCDQRDILIITQA